MTGEAGRRPRADAQRNVDALVRAATTVFATAGVDAPIRTIAGEAGVGLATLYRHFPQRSDLVAAVFRREVDACAAAAPVLAAAHEPGEALGRWLLRYTEFLAAKRGLAAALHSGDPAFGALPGYFDAHLGPALEGLLHSAVEAGQARDDVDARDILHTVANLCVPAADGGTERAQRMVAVFVDGLRRTDGR
ncbi:TetR/AcrR family transcriptional regulator [Nakamurella endophytica]|uniref:TetR family transcriptional regulator n=1 Tax=Nakamurella endophytica TaxID=1748367 RepID=A0A917T3A5_9ACTN|nr:TetR/AcrR family transcriptional regulator [Nakamurella endophytica]GGM09070.1 TetR family transcriptional regulator [Nakamurella endophytica]